MNPDKETRKLPQKFTPPSLPFPWVATTIIVPVLVVIVPHVITLGEFSLSVWIAAGLGLFSIMLIASCAYLVMQRYDVAFEHQVIQLKAAHLENEAERLSKQAAELLDELKKNEEERAEIRASLAKTNEELERIKTENDEIIRELALAKEQEQSQEQGSEPM